MVGSKEMGEVTTITDGTTDPQIAAEETLGVGDGSAGHTRHDSKEMIRLLGPQTNRAIWRTQMTGKLKYLLKLRIHEGRLTPTHRHILLAGVENLVE